MGSIPVWAISLRGGLDDPCESLFNSEYSVICVCLTEFKLLVLYFPSSYIESIIFPYQLNTCSVATEYLRETVNCLIRYVASAFVFTALWNINVAKTVIHQKI